MDRFENTLKKIIKTGNWIGGTCLVIIMFVIVAAVASRLLKISLAGANEIVDTAIVIAVAFALPYTALLGGQVAIEVLTERLSPKMKAYADVISVFLTLLLWLLILVASIVITGEKGLAELSYFVKLPILPFRIVWIFGLILMCLVFLLQLIKAINTVVKNKWTQ
jgi:TRAP-type C4-dicarboxylate transport system permease small subunit